MRKLLYCNTVLLLILILCLVSLVCPGLFGYCWHWTAQVLITGFLDASVVKCEAVKHTSCVDMEPPPPTDGQLVHGTGEGQDRDQFSWCATLFLSDNHVPRDKANHSWQIPAFKPFGSVLSLLRISIRKKQKQFCVFDVA